jgi:hypothetical protein
MSKFKERWGIKHNYQLVVIFIVFAVTGSTSAYLLIFPIYQLLLLFFGFISGQKAFFFPIVKRMVKMVGFGFLFRTRKD